MEQVTRQVQYSCQCEHAAHFANSTAVTPNGNPGHRYGVRFFLSYLETFSTPYGTFLICLDCKQDCAGVGPGRTSWEAGSAQRKG